MVLARLFEEDASGGPLYTRILKECLLGHGDSSREASQGKDQEISFSSTANKESGKRCSCVYHGEGFNVVSE